MAATDIVIDSDYGMVLSFNSTDNTNHATGAPEKLVYIDERAFNDQRIPNKGITIIF